MQPSTETFAVHEIAAAARVPVERVRQAMRADGMPANSARLPAADAIWLVRRLRRGTSDRYRALPLTLMTEPRARRAAPLALSAVLHALVVAGLITAATLGLL